MKHTFTLLLILVSSVVALAQPVANRIETDCSSNSQSVYEVMGNDKVLFIVSSATDCSICMSEAPGLATFANNNQTKIQVWGAMNLLSGTTTCSFTTEWRNDYGWNNVFMFVDDEDYWATGTFTYFTVIDPRDSTVAYQGSSFEDAKTSALAVADNVTSIETPSASWPMSVKDIYPNPFKDELNLVLANPQYGQAEVWLYDIIGKEIYHNTFETSKNTKELYLDLKGESLKKGYYLIRIEIEDEIHTIRILRD